MSPFDAFTEADRGNLKAIRTEFLNGAAAPIC
jgi:hypothetical protein